MSTPFLISYAVLWVVVVVLTLTLLVAVRQIGLIHRRIPPMGARMVPVGPEMGQEMPTFDQADVFGRRARLVRDGGRRALLVFISPRCSSCKELAPAIRSIAKSEARRVDIVLISDGTADEVRQYAETYHLSKLPVIASRDLQDEYQIATTPYALLVDEHGRLVSKGIVNDLEHLVSLLRAGELGVDSLETYAESVGQPSSKVAAAGRSNGGGNVSR
ncbi:MAG: redoxin domain-containing protein [Actinomycetota bacterium]